MIPSLATDVLLQQLDLLQGRSSIRKKGPTEDEYRAIVTPAFKLLNADETDRKFTDEERALLESMINTCRFHYLIVFEMTQVFVNRPYPPVGYAGVYNRLTPFDPRHFHSLFYGCAVLWVDYERGYEKDWAKSINALIPDISPNPPSFMNNDAINGPWYPSLGRGGWIAVCDSNNIETGDVTTAIVLVCSPDPAVLDELETMLDLLWLDGRNIEDVYNATSWFRDYMVENKRRIMYIVAKHGLKGISPMGDPSPIITASALDPKPRLHGLTKSIVNRLRDEYAVTDPELLPSSFRLPSHIEHVTTVTKTQKKNHEAVFDHIEISNPDDDQEQDDLQDDKDDDLLCDTIDCQTHGIVPGIEMHLDDLIPYVHCKTDFLRLSNACEMKGKVVRIAGPTFPIKILSIGPNVKTKDWLNAFPAVIPPSPDCRPSLSGIVVTSLSTNSNSGPSLLGMNWHGQLPKEVKERNYGETPLETLRALFIRYSDLELYK
jgi:hypothetical protein